MKFKKVIGILAFFTMILIMFIAGYIFSKSYKTVKNYQTQYNAVKWSFESENIESIINLSDEKIYPGSNGDFQIEIDATGSEAEINYEILVYNEKNFPTNFKFWAETKNQLGEIINKTIEYSSFNELASKDLFGNIPVEENNQKRIITVYWNWDFNENDTSFIDSNDAILSYDEYGNSSLNCSFNIEIVGKQA